MSRNINMFIKPIMWFDLREKVKAVLDILIFPTSVDRDYREQYAYFCQGRESLKDTNIARKLAGLGPISEEANRHKVTWTMNSKHVINLEDERLDNDKSLAIDFGIIYEGKYVTNPKADVNGDNLPDYIQVATLAETLGFKSGMHFRNPDYPHLEVDMSKL